MLACRYLLLTVYAKRILKEQAKGKEQVKILLNGRFYSAHTSSQWWFTCLWCYQFNIHHFRDITNWRFLNMDMTSGIFFLVGKSINTRYWLANWWRPWWLSSHRFKLTLTEYFWILFIWPQRCWNFNDV